MTAIVMTDEMIAERMERVGDIPDGTRAKCVEIIKAAAKAGHDVWYVWGCGGGEHSCPPGLALDLMVHNEAAGDWVRNYIWVNRERLRVRHVIWEQHITSTVVSPGVRRLMEDRGSVTQNHYDHNHVLFLASDYDEPVQGPVIETDIPDDDPTLERGDTGKRVEYLQAGLKRVFPSYAGKLDVDGSFGPKTEKAVMEFQLRSHLTVDGKVGPATRAELATYGIDTFKPYVAPAPAPKPAAPIYPGKQTRRGDKGDRVRTIQRRLKARGWDIDTDGSFGPAMEQTVERFQRNKNLKVDGVVGPKTWAALWALPIT